MRVTHIESDDVVDPRQVFAALPGPPLTDTHGREDTWPSRTALGGAAELSRFRCENRCLGYYSWLVRPTAIYMRWRLRSEERTRSHVTRVGLCDLRPRPPRQ